MNFLQKIVNNFSIKQKLITLSMVTSTIVTIITCGGFIIFNIVSERSDLVDEMRLVSRIFAEELSEYVVDNEKDQIIKSLDTLKTRESLIQACLYVQDSDKAFVEYIRDKKRSKNCNEIEMVKGKYQFRKDKEDNEYLIVNSYIISNDHKVGYLTMLSNLDRMHNRIKLGIYNSFILFLIIIFISYLISRFLQRGISKPILHLADVSYMVRSGDYHVRAHHYSNDELGILTDAYNNMLEEIQNAKENLEDKVIERTKDLEKVMQVKVQFLSNMSHEIRTPIHGIMNYADFLVQDWDILDNDKRYGFIKKLHHNSARLLSLINNLLDLSKFDANKMEFCMQKHDLAPIIEDVVQECEALYLQNKNITIRFDIDSKENDTIVVVDQERIAQVIRNLLSNAIKFTSKGEISLKLELTKFKKPNGSKVQGIKLSLTDSGIGIPVSELEYIFDKFNQSAKTKTGAGGTGLGLAISKEIIKAHQGIIWAENNKNKDGSTFSFIIPIHQKITNLLQIT